jgi:hypothetical protein
MIYIRTKDGITVLLNNKPYSVSVDDKHYIAVVEAVEDNVSEEEILEIFERVANKIKTASTDGYGIEYNNGIVTYDGEPIHGYAVDKLVSFVDQGIDVDPLCNFLEKLHQNPSKTVVDNLYEFLEAGKIPLTPEGDFMAYKAVRKDYRDIHSGTYDNSVGQYCSIARNKVDEDRNRTCSTGLHVCSFDYLPHFSHADGHVMLVSVDPADVVAIPADYNNTKMRVAAYTVVGEVEDYYQNHKDVLAGTQIWDTQDKDEDEDKPLRYTIQWKEFGNDELYSLWYTHDDLDEADEEARDLMNDDSNTEFSQVVDQDGYVYSFYD